MPTVTQFARATASMGPAVRAAEIAGVRAAALQSTTIIRAEIRSAAPSGQLKMNGKKPRKIGASFKMLTGPRASISAEGPLHLVERNTAAHYEPRGFASSRVSYRLRGGRLVATEKKRRGRGAAKASGVSIPGIGFRRYVLHPGTKGKHPFAKGAALARPKAGRTILTEVSKGIRAALR